MLATPLKFYLGEESHYITEDYESRTTSIFADQYKKALRIVDSYIATTDVTDSKIPQQESRNNIVAFIGDRGTGKTSCMTSVLNMLEDHVKNKKKSFAHIDMVDPSFFDENTNIIYLVVGKMFAAFKKSIDKDEHQKWLVNNLMNAFCEVLSQISVMEKSPLSDNETDINQLSNLLATVNLKKKLGDLVNCYLEYYKKDFLVIPVDDIDNNIEHAYLMMEQIRKYLILPNVIIFISFKLEQISNVAELYFTKLYKPLSSSDKSLPTVVTDMAQKYLLKLFPLEHRIALPNLGTMMDKELEVYKRRSDEKPLLAGSSMKYTMTALIFKKTRYLFYHSTGENNQIVPTNLREYRNLLSLLCNMKDYDKKNKEEYNKQQFRDYFYGEWIEKHLSKEGRVIAQKLIANTEAGQFNKLVVVLLSQYSPLGNVPIQEFQELLPDDEQTDQMTIRGRRSTGIQSVYEYMRILDNGNFSYNVSIGDVFSVLNEWKKYVIIEEDKALLFFVESLYSIKMYHYYDEITESDVLVTSPNSAIDNTIKRLDDLEGVSNYDQLIGGAFFNPNLLRFLPFEGNAKDKKSRSYRIVNIKPLKDVISNCATRGTIDDTVFQLVEFFALTLSRRLEGKLKDSLSSLYRLLPEVYYRTDLQKSQKAIFDLGSFFVSITNIKFAYQRIHSDFYQIALNRENSLLNMLMAHTTERYDLNEYDNNRFLSWSSIRNAVILQELGNSFSYVKTGRTQNSDQIELLRDFFNQVSNFYIKTYDKTEEGDAYGIKFDYAQIYVDFFDRLKENHDAIGLFKLVFDDMDTENDTEDEKSFDVAEIIHGLQKEVKKDTLGKRILEHSSVTKDNVDFWGEFDAAVTDNKISKDTAKQILYMLKSKFEL